ncbi:MAG TPA: bifunctional DNA-formamidopyrimidine glycosylase/DNA-(apurinic or apyrimidinic site) lyase [Verrucomicrobiae bacterium]|nr:bifunctional DNA-formamidopyrimidine glycosylase/DNA-(apurinic or apyrimidinic site) lyase [Verrucomicrobiae bacterium]
MPELPEVETIVRDLRPRLRGEQVVHVRLGHPSLIRYPGPTAFADGLTGATTGGLRRRGKFILLELRGPRLVTGAVLVVHLGMSGSLCVVEAGVAERPHTHLALRLRGGGELRFVDPRRFGRLLLGAPDELVRLGRLPTLGPEPLGPGLPDAWWQAALRRSHRPVKALLLDQRVVAGCGNIYADEACFRAGIRPQRRADRCTRAEASALGRALEAVLWTAIANRGSSIASYRDGLGARGSAQRALAVYGRAGQPCSRCQAPLRGTVVAQRTTVYCRSCQR